MWKKNGKFYYVELKLESNDNLKHRAATNNYFDNGLVLQLLQQLINRSLIILLINQQAVWLIIHLVQLI